MSEAGKAQQLPPGPRAPALVQSLRYYRDPYGFLAGCQRRHGNVFTVRQIPCGTMVYVAEPQVIRKVFADPGTHLAGAINSYMRPVLGNGLLLLDHEAHASRRKLMAPGFGSERVRQLGERMAALTSASLDRWPVGEPVALRPRLEQLTLDIVLDALFAGAVGELAPLIVQLKTRGIVDSVLLSLPFGLARWRLVGESARTLAQIDALIAAELAGRRRGDRPDQGLVAGLLPALDDRALRDEILTLAFAGHETVATTLAWAFERLARHPHLRVDSDELAEATIKETMRARSCIADVTRELTSPLEAGEHTLPAGTRVAPAISCTHMRADLYPEPERFEPARFVGESQPEPFAFFPFGGGVRRCLGAHFAMLEMRVILRAVLERFSLRADEETPERGVGNGVTIAPSRGARVILARRA